MNNFAVLTIVNIYTETSVIIRITTNNSVHLTCYYTDKQPVRHKTSRTDRGLTHPWGAYYCFVAWRTVEQIEPGDTLTHTFEIPNWLYCQTKWFAFRGTVSGVLSPSVSPIFSHHRSEWIVTATFYPDAHPEHRSVDGRVQHRQLDPELSWQELRASSGNSAADEVLTDAVIIAASAWTEHAWWTLCRSIELFDTTAIPIEAVLIEGFVSIMGHNKINSLNTSPDLALVTSNPIAPMVLLKQDFTSLGNTPLAPVMSYADFDPDGRNIFTLNNNGLLSINKTRATRFGFREYTHDILGNVPNFILGKEVWFEWFSADQGDPNKPELTLTYSIPH